MHTKRILFCSIVVVLFSFKTTTKVIKETNENNTYQIDGKQLFMANCGACHHATRNLTGPSFYGVRTRWKDKKLLYAYVRNSTEVIKKDAYAKALFEKWNKVVMTSFPKLKDAEIDAIFNYVDEEAKKKGLLN
ncbi:MAG: cytochrome c [Chitinophagaceae bacterium]|jgi:mono/diheme cytochrome c family protein|nr:cytochrome c [Chitinophagaceae bacterium]